MIKLTIIHTNDLHAEYDAWFKCAALIKRRRAELGSETCLVVDSGDHFDMSVDECGLSGGRLHLELLADVGLDAFAPGNNEFYRMPSELLARLSLDSPFPWLLTTVTERSGGAYAGFARSLIVEKGLSIGLLGALHPMDGAAEELHGLMGLDLAASLTEEARALRKRGVAIVILLSHYGLDGDLRLAEETRGLIDVIVGGHSHSELREPLLKDRTLIVQAGGLGKFVGELELEIEDGEIRGQRYRLHVIDSLHEADDAQRAIFERYGEETRVALGEELCVLEEEVPRETLLRLAAELLRRRYSAEFGFMFEPAATGGLAKGPLHVGDVFGVCRSFITPARFEISGKQIEGLLRERHDPSIVGARGFGIGFRPQGLAFGKLQFAGLEWEERAGRLAGISIGGAPLDPERWYLAGAATHLFSSASGGYPSLEGSRALESTRFRYLRELLIEAFKSGEAATILREPARQRPSSIFT